MKKHLIILAMMGILLTPVVSAQTTFDFGFKGGGLRAKMSGDPSIVTLLDSALTAFTGTVELDTDARIGLVGGAFLTINVSPTIAIQPELLYSVKGVETTFKYNYQSQDWESTLKWALTYIEIPVLIKYKIPTDGKVKPGLYLGPALGFNSKGTFKQDDQVANDPLNFGEFDIANVKSTDFSAVFGGELGFVMSSFNLVLDVRYNLGLTKAFEDADLGTNFYADGEWVLIDRTTGAADDMKHKGLSASVGISFPIGGGTGL
jgi:hypothetical protein